MEKIRTGVQGGMYGSVRMKTTRDGYIEEKQKEEIITKDADVEKDV